MEQLKGFENPNKLDHVCRIVKSMYGLKQASRVCDHFFRDMLTKLGFQPPKYAVRKVDTQNGNGIKFIALAYFDDIIFIEMSKSALINVKKGLQESFKLMELVPVSSVLGVKTVCMDNNFFLSQKSYIEKVLQIFSMHKSRPVRIPMDPGSYNSLTEKKKRTDSEALEMENIP